MAEPIIMRCSTCRLPVFRLENGCLVIESRHHGEKHVNAISVAQLVEEIARSERVSFDIGYTEQAGQERQAILE